MRVARTYDELILRGKGKRGETGVKDPACVITKSAWESDGWQT